MLREDLKKELDRLSDEQLQRIADFITHVEFRSRQATPSALLWQKATPSERVRDFREWVLQLPKGSPSLPDEAFNRDSIYE
jgi:hypothetical protein